MNSFFGVTFNIFRRKRGVSFRKRLGVFNYKIGKVGYHKQPGAIDLATKESLKKVIILTINNNKKIRRK